MPADNKFAIRIVLIGVAAIILVVLVMQYNSKHKNVKSTQEETHVRAKERYQDPNASQMQMQMDRPTYDPTTDPNVATLNMKDAPSSVKPSEPLSNEDYKAVDFSTENKLPTDCYPRDKLTADDLLPKDAANSKWAQVNPAGQGELKDQNFLNAGYQIGIDTIGQSLRNANYQLRSDPPNPKLAVGPWQQSTIEYDNSRKYFEIGEC